MNLEECGRLTTRSRSAENISMIEKGVRWIKATNENWQEKRFLKNRVKILIAGLPHSGKTCFINRLRDQTGCTFSGEIMTAAKVAIEDVIISSIDKIIEFLQKDDSIESMPHLCQIMEVYQAERKNLDALSILKETINQILLYPVADKVIKDNYFEFPRNFRYFLDNISRISNGGYMPSSGDIVRAPIISSEIEEAWLVIRRNPYVLTALSGSRLLVSARSIGYFADSASIVFMVSLDRFDIDLGKAFDIFEDVVNVSYLNKSAFVLLLNKSKDFTNKIKTFNFEDSFPEFVNFMAEDDISTEQRIEEYVKMKLKSSILKSQVCYLHVSDILSSFTAINFHNCIKSSVLSFNLSNYYYV